MDARKDYRKGREDIKIIEPDGRAPARHDRQAHRKEDPTYDCRKKV